MDAARLAPFALLDHLSEEQRSTLAASVDELSVEAGAELVRVGEFGYHLYLVEEGEADVLRSDDVVATLGPGSYFGEIALLVTGTRTATVRARTPMRLLVVFDRSLREIDRDASELGGVLRAGMVARMPGG